VDYRRLNSVTIQDTYPLPRIDESLDALASASILVLWFCLVGTGKYLSVLMPGTKQHSLRAMGSGSGKYCYLD